MTGTKDLFDSICSMDNLYRALKTLEDVPERLRKQVEEILGGEA